MTTLLVASTGGHLHQLHELRPRLVGVDADVVWVTFDTPQSRSLLEGQEVVHVPHTRTRDYLNVARNTATAVRLLRDRDVRGVVSTGAGIALSFLPLARALGREAHYIESATRSGGPSLTGRLLQGVPGVRLYTQHRRWEGGRWRFAGSVFDGFDVADTGSAQAGRIVVTLGAHEQFGFRRLLERLVAIVPADAQVLWQTGATAADGLPIEARPYIPAGELLSAMRDADVVVAHAGTGSALAALEAGRCPILVPRDPARGEHVDDHQQQIARELDDLGVAIGRDVEDLTAGDLLLAAGRSVRRAARPAPFRLVGA
jgi:UDP-N-acetylglucosamine--N-acetylmuramyl-(pentapeptide) pyrophosphoryl-undecaprenol N-acetylglucosamine transferase